VLIVRFVRSGGIGMLRMMGGSPDTPHHDHDHDHDHDQHDDHDQHRH
jgi:hypothetical protein